MMECCPHCGSDYGYYRVTRMSGIGGFNYNFDGTQHEENGDMHDCLTYTENKTMYCIQCKKKVGIDRGGE